MCVFCVFSDDDIGRYYEGNGSNVYHLNNFNNLPRSYGESNNLLCNSTYM